MWLDGCYRVAKENCAGQSQAISGLGAYDGQNFGTSHRDEHNELSKSFVSHLNEGPSGMLVKTMTRHYIQQNVRNHWTGVYPIDNTVPILF